jgi:hypothetical protein
MTVRAAFLTTLLFASVAYLHSSEDQLSTLHGHCSVAPATKADRVRLELEDGECGSDRDHCHNHDDDEMPLSNFTGLTLADFEHEGAHIDAVIGAEAGRITCSGVVHALTLDGEFTFEPSAAFVERMRQIGFTGYSSQLLEAYTLFHIDVSWVQDLQSAGVTEMSAENILPLRIFKVDAGYVREMSALGFPHLSAGKLIAFKVQGVNPEEVKQYRALGYEPTEDELIQMRIFKVTPDFIQRMEARGLGKLTIAKLVQVRIFNLAD